MHRFFVTPEQVGTDEIIITGSDVNHMKNVLRMKEGEEFLVCDGNNQEYRCSLQEFSKDQVVGKILEVGQGSSELPSKIVLFQGLPKGEKMELIVQKAVELGASQIIPVEMKRSIVKLDGKKAKSKQQRWQAISEGAAKQAGRNMIPPVSLPVGFSEACTMAVECDYVLVPYELAEGMAETKQLIADILPGKSIGIFIGPEGGFAPEEVEKLQMQGGTAITLGKRILRTETAGLTILSILMFHLSN